MDNSKCHACGKTFVENDDIVFCPRCNAYHHEDCWEKNNGCASNECNPSQKRLEPVEQEELKIAQPVASHSEKEANIPPVEPLDDTKSELVCSINGARGRILHVYKDRVAIEVRPCLGSLITGSVSYGEKTIFYRDCIGIQYKKSGFSLGYILFDTASPRKNNNFFSQNSFPFKENANAEKVVMYIKKRLEAFKK